MRTEHYLFHVLGITPNSKTNVCAQFCLFGLRHYFPVNNFSVVGTFSWVEPVQRNEDELSYSRTQHRIFGEIRTRDLAIKSLALY